MVRKTLSTRRFIKPSYAYLIEKKRDGQEFTKEEIRYIIDSILDGEMPDFQMAAMAMAIFFQGMSAQETAILTEEMMLSGEVIDLSHIAKPKIDKKQLPFDPLEYIEELDQLPFDPAMDPHVGE